MPGTSSKALLRRPDLRCLRWLYAVGRSAGPAGQGSPGIEPSCRGCAQPLRPATTQRHELPPGLLARRPYHRAAARRVTLTPLFSDLKGYTGAAESMDPEALMAWINDYLNAMAELVEKHGGVADHYVGDGIKSNFGFPVPSETEETIASDAINAVRCTLAMSEEMKQLNARWQVQGLVQGWIRIGIFTGPATLGAIGGRRSLKFTTVGDSINVAARLEAFDKGAFAAESDESASRNLIGEDT